jgi:hypothetical protein
MHDFVSDEFVVVGQLAERREPLVGLAQQVLADRGNLDRPHHLPDASVASSHG